MTSSNGNIFHVTGLLWGTPQVTGGFPSQIDAFFDLRLHKRLRANNETPVIWDVIALITNGITVMYKLWYQIKDKLHFNVAENTPGDGVKWFTFVFY